MKSLEVSSEEIIELYKAGNEMPNIVETAMYRNNLKKGEAVNYVYSTIYKYWMENVRAKEVAK